MKYHSIITFFIICFFSTEMVFPSTFFQQNEELLYEVSFWKIKLGTIRVITDSVVDYKGMKTQIVKAEIASYPQIPFIEIKANMKSFLDTSGAFSYYFQGNTKKSDNDWLYENIDFDYQKKRTYIEHWRKKEKVFSADWHLSKRYNDGLSILFAARRFLHSQKQIKLPIVIYEDSAAVDIAFTSKTEKIKIDAVDYPVSTKYFYGELTGNGIYGLTGKFEGWFSNDPSAVPIKAKLSVYVGTVDINLVRWKRINWTPPKAN